MKRILLLLLFYAAGFSPLHAAVYNESGGLVIMEAENTESPMGLWEEQNSLVSYTGPGYLQFLGNTYLTGPATSPLEYTFKINQAGLYYLHLHAAKTNVFDGIELRKDVSNDCYVRVEGDYNAGPGPYTSPGDNASLAQLQTDTKYYTYTELATDKWKWENGIGNGEGSLDPTSGGKRVAVYDFKAGETYKLIVSGRSKFFRLNRIMFRHESVAASTAQNLGNPESDTIQPTQTYVYDATSDFPSYTNGVVPYYIDGLNDCLGIRANIEEYRDKFATASRTFDGVEGMYDVTITALRELDGECIYRFLVNGSIVGTVQNSETTVDYAPQKHVFRNIAIPAGATIAVESNTDTNGKIPESGGTAWARGRWTELTLVPSGLSIVNPPAGRVALVSDGNSPDPDDIGAKAVAFGLLKASGLSDRLVHLSHSCDLDPFSNPGSSQSIGPVDELRRQAKLYALSDEGIALFGPYSNLAAHYNCRSNQTEAVSNLTAAINASSEEDPLWIIEAGEPDIIGYALDNADSNKWQYVHIISHHPANDNSGDYWTWPQIQAFGITEHQIGDQNVGLKVLISSGLWDWAENNSDPGIAWIWDQLKYVEQDPVVTFQAGRFDCSDAGMMYWWITGADIGGNSNSTPVEIKDMLLHEYYEDPPGTDITMVVLGPVADWTAGSTWSDGLPAHADAVYTVPASGNLRGEAGTSVFPGDSLTVEAGGMLRIRALDSLGETTTVSNLILSGGSSFATGQFAQILVIAGSDVANVLAGSITNSGYTRFLTYHAYSGGTVSRSLKVLSTIEGEGHIQAWEASTGFGGENVVIANAANTFSGTWEVGADSTLIFNNAGAVGTADVVVLESGTLQILGDWNAYANLTVADTATASVDLGTYDWHVSSLTIGSSSIPAGATYTVAELNAISANPVFSGSGTIHVGPAPPPPPPAVVAGWDTWNSTTAPGVSYAATDVTASATASATGGDWSNGDSAGRGSSKDTTWGTHAGPPSASAVTDIGPANFTLTNAKTDGEITFTITNTGAEDIVLSQFHFDALAFRFKAPRTYALNVLPGSDITVGNVFTSAAQAITTFNSLKTDDADPETHDQHDDIDLDLTGLDDHTLESGETAIIQLAFSGGAGDNSGGHHLFVDNVAISKVPPQVVPPVADAGFGRIITLPDSFVVLEGTATDDVSVLYTVWSQESGPNTSMLSEKTTLNPTASGLVEGTYVFRLTATDNAYNTAYDEVSVMVVTSVTPAIVQAMYDQWTVDLGLTPSESNPSLDLDGDGFTTMEEFLSGHDPRDAASAFAVESIQAMEAPAEQIVLQWESRPDRTYSILRADEPGGEYAAIAEGIAYPQDSYRVDAGEAESGYFKVEVDVQ